MHQRSFEEQNQMSPQTLWIRSTRHAHFFTPFSITFSITQVAESHERRMRQKSYHLFDYLSTSNYNLNSNILFRVIIFVQMDKPSGVCQSHPTSGYTNTSRCYDIINIIVSHAHHWNFSHVFSGDTSLALSWLHSPLLSVARRRDQ